MSEIIPFDGLAGGFCRTNGRGHGNKGTYVQLPILNMSFRCRRRIIRLQSDVETMFLTTSIEYSYLSSTTVREIAAFGGDVTQFVPQAVAVELEKKMKEKGECNYE